MDDKKRDNLEQDLDKKMLTLSRVKVAKEEYQFKIRDLERNVRRLERDIEIQDQEIAKLETEIKILQEELNNG